MVYSFHGVYVLTPGTISLWLNSTQVNWRMSSTTSKHIVCIYQMQSNRVYIIILMFTNCICIIHANKPYNSSRCIQTDCVYIYMCNKLTVYIFACVLSKLTVFIFSECLCLVLGIVVMWTRVYCLILMKFQNFMKLMLLCFIFLL